MADRISVPERICALDRRRRHTRTARQTRETGHKARALRTAFVVGRVEKKKRRKADSTRKSSKARCLAS
ncbi:hypothetical protein TGRH88_006030 [Toxoplasma gondii]|uniref:Uncharacterized protein n=1 Tax=Toxoplasma gondii TaxID=5811 RepID=A0A7J6KFU3_TOXGO|nr:hypothetical protein TGRH88_006030 [Toxoplasma gondii]